jgi:hypothetical protein
MKDIEIILENKPGTLALLGETLGLNKISLEGGGVFQMNQSSIAHFLVAEPERAREVLAKAGLQVVAIHEVIIQKLRQDVPGQLGLFCRKLADAGVNIIVQYSDHANQLIIVPDDYTRAQQVSEDWMREWS